MFLILYCSLTLQFHSLERALEAVDSKAFVLMIYSINTMRYQIRHLVLILTGLVGLVMLVLIVRLIPTLKANHDKITTINKQLDELKKQHDAQVAHQDYFNSDAYLEHQVRLKLNYKRPDEHVVFIYKKPYTTASVSQPLPQNKQISLFNKWSAWLAQIWNK